MSQNVINQQKQIALDLKDEELMFGLNAKQKAPIKGKGDVAGFIQDICGELKTGIQRKDIANIFSIEIE